MRTFLEVDFSVSKDEVFGIGENDVVKEEIDNNKLDKLVFGFEKIVLDLQLFLEKQGIINVVENKNILLEGSEHIIKSLKNKDKIIAVLKSKLKELEENKSLFDDELYTMIKKEFEGYLRYFK